MNLPYRTDQLIIALISGLTKKALSCDREESAIKSFFILETEVLNIYIYLCFV